MITMMSYNLLNYGEKDTAEEITRRERTHEAIRASGPDVLVAQEIWADGEGKERRAGELVRELAEATGLDCELPSGEISVAIGNHPFCVAVLWKPGIIPVRWRTCGGTQLWHCLAKVDLDVGGQVVSHASFHATPFGRNRRADENERVVALMTRPDNRPPGLIGADWNTVHADRVHLPGYIAGEASYEAEQWVLYDRVDPYASQAWHPDFIYQCRTEYDQFGQRRWQADREPGEVLYAGGLVDAAAHLRVPWARTTGYWPEGDPFGDRRIDAIKVTGDVRPALRSHRVDDNELTITCSDHLPVTVAYEPGAILRS